MNSQNEEWEMALKKAQVKARIKTEQERPKDEFEDAVFRARMRNTLNPTVSEEQIRRDEFESARKRAAYSSMQRRKQRDIKNYVPGSGHKPRSIPKVPETTPRQATVLGVRVQTYGSEPSLETAAVNILPAEKSELVEEMEIPGVTTGEENKTPAKPEKSKPAKTTAPIKLEDVVKAAPVETKPVEKQKPIKIPRFEGAPPEMYDVGTLFENMGLHGQRKSIYRLIFNVMAKKSSIVTGPSASGKTKLVSYVVDLIRLIDPSLLEEYNKMDLKDLVENPEKYKRKIFYFTELQTAVRGSGDNRDIIKAIFGGEKYRDGNSVVDLLFGMATVASTNQYWDRYLKNDPEFKSRANLIYIDSSMDGLVGHRNARNAKRSGRTQKKEASIGREELAAFLVDRMMMEIPKEKVIDPSSAFVDQYVPLTFSANRYIEQYEEDENSCLKWYNNEDKYELNGKTIFILGLRNKYRAERLRRRDILKAIKENDNVAYAKEIGWSEEEVAKLEKSLEKAEEDVDWQACWDSYLESLKEANAPPELIAEVINRHVVNGKITVIDPLTGEEAVLAQYPKPAEQPERTESMVVTDMQGVFDGYENKSERDVETKIIDAQEVEKQTPEYQLTGSYDSVEEAACAILMQKYIEEFEPKEGETVHISEGLEGTIDFRLNGSFIEYHPIALCKLENGFGDFTSTEDFEKYKAAREALPEEKRKEFDQDVRNTLAQDYFAERAGIISQSEAHKGKELIVAASPEEVYDKVIARFGNNYPSKQEFLDEFKLVKSMIKEEAGNEGP